MFSAKFEGPLAHDIHYEALENPCHDFVVFPPRERANALETKLPTTRLEDLSVAMANIETPGLLWRVFYGNVL